MTSCNKNDVLKFNKGQHIFCRNSENVTQTQDIELLSLQRPMAERFLKWRHNSFQGIKSDDVMTHHTSSSLRLGLLSFIKQTKTTFIAATLQGR